MTKFIPKSGATKYIDASNISQNIAIDTNGSTAIRVMNDGSATAWIAFGASPPTSDLMTNMPVGPLASEIFAIGAPQSLTYAAAIAQGSSGKVYFTPDGVGSSPLDPDLKAPVISLGVAPDHFPIQIDANFDISILSTDIVRLQVATDLLFGSLSLDATTPVGTGVQSITGLSDIGSGAHYIRERIERGAQYGPWSNILKHGDITAPTLSSPNGSQTSDTTAAVGVTSNEAEGTLYYAILPASTAAPAAAAFLAGTTGGLATGSTVSPLASINNFTASGILPATVANPSGEPNTDTVANLSIDCDGSVGTIYWFVSANATPPSAADLKAGTGAAAFGNQPVLTAGTQHISASGLAALATYYAHFLFTPNLQAKVHFFQQDLAGNESAIVSSTAFNLTRDTLIATSPSFKMVVPSAVWSTAVGQDKSPYATISGTPTLSYTGTAGVGAPMMVRANRAASSGKRVFEIAVTTVSGLIIIGWDNRTDNFSTGFPVPGNSDTNGISLMFDAASWTLYYNGLAANVSGLSDFVLNGDVFSLEYDPAGIVRFFRTRGGATIQVGTDTSITPFGTAYGVSGANSAAVLNANFGQGAFAHTPTTGFAAY